MKKKIFLAVIAIFVICLTCGMLFVACNEKEDDNGGKKPGDITIESTAGDVLAAVVNELDAVANGTSKEYNVALEIVAGDVPVFTLALEQYEGKDYIYAAVGNEFVKINGFDVGGVVVEVLNWLVGRDGKIAGMVPLDAAGFNTSVGALLAEMNILSSSCEADDDAYRVGLNMSSIAGLLSGLNVDGKIAEAGLSGLIDPIVGALIDLLEIDLGADVKPSVGALIDYIGQNVDVNAYFGFNDDAADTSTEPFGKFDISKKIADARKLSAINALNISTQLEFEALDVTEDGGTAAEAVAHKYVLDIDIDLDPFVLVREYGDYEFGILSMISKEGYLMDNENPLKLFIDNEKFSMDTIMDMVADAGYLHISLDDVAIEANEVAGIKAGDTLKNLFTLHFNSEEGKAIVSAAIVEEVLDKNYAVGGVYDIEALTHIINSLIPAGPAAEEGETEVKPCEDGKHVDDVAPYCVCDVCKAQIAHVDADENCICDNCGAVTDWMGLVGYLFNNIDNFIKVEKSGETVTGATVMFQNIADFLINNVVKHAITAEQLEVVKAQLPTLMASVIGGNALKIDLTGISFAYGELTEKDRVATADLVYNLREEESLTGTNDDMYMETVTGVTAKDGGEIIVGSLVTVTGTAFDEKETTITTDGIIMAVDGDTYYVGILTDFYANYEGAEAIVNGFIGTAGTHVDLDTLIKPNWPFYGVLAYTVPAQA